MNEDLTDLILEMIWGAATVIVNDLPEDIEVGVSEEVTDMVPAMVLNDIKEELQAAIWNKTKIK